MPPMNDGTSHALCEQNNGFQRIHLNRQPVVGSGENEQTQAPGDTISESSTEKAPSPYQSHIDDNQPDFHVSQNFNQNFNLPPYFDPIPQLNQDDDQTPFNILNELSIIDLRIQTDIHRKMQLYKELHMYLQNNRQGEQHNNTLSSVPNITPQPNQLVEAFLPPSNPRYCNQPPPNINSKRFNSPCVVQNDSTTPVIPPSISSVQSTSNQHDLEPLPQINLQQNSVPSHKTQEPIVLTLDEDDDDSHLTASSSCQSVQESAKKVGCIGCRPLVLIPEKTVVKLPPKTKVNDMKVCLIFLLLHFLPFNFNNSCG
jgi:hypothetical protein